MHYPMPIRSAVLHLIGKGINYFKTMDNNFDIDLQLVGTCAGDLRKCQHLYLRGNFQQDMFYDKVDIINVWNRLWLSAKATGAQIVSFVILNNHLHIIVIFTSDEQRAKFKQHFRQSITQYHNRRYQVKGTLGTRRLNHGNLKDTDDVKDCLCYHIRNVVHHGITAYYLEYPFSTARYVFGLESDSQKGYYTWDNIPDNLARAFLPARKQLPKEWRMTREGMIVPPEGVFRRDIIEAIFNNSVDDYLETLTHRTTREAADKEEPELAHPAGHLRNVPTPDEQVVEFVRANSRIPIPSMTDKQKRHCFKKCV